MSRIVLIHGFATGIRYSIFRPARGTDAGFSAFCSLVERGEAKAFRWDIEERASFIQSISPFYALNVYNREKTIALKTETHRALAEFLAQENPETIICHSMGAFLLLEHMKRVSLPDSVCRIVFTQADANRSEFVLNDEIEQRLRTGDLTFVNAYCQWDPSLWCSVFVNGSRAGLFGARHPLVRDVFWPLVKPLNLHTSAIRSGKFIRLLNDGTV